MKLVCGILEDETFYKNQLVSALKRWSVEVSCELELHSAQTASAFLKMEPERMDILFLDIVLAKEEQGIKVAKKLRKQDYEGEIVFLTNFREYVLEGYPVHALDYLLKPVTYEKITSCMNRILENRQKKDFVVKCRDQLIRIPFQDILYFQSSGHNTLVISIKSSITVPVSFGTLIGTLPRCFSRCHRTLIVNLKHVIRMNQKEIILITEEKLPISRGYQELVYKDFMNYFQ